MSFYVKFYVDCDDNDQARTIANDMTDFDWSGYGVQDCEIVDLELCEDEDEQYCAKYYQRTRSYDQRSKVSAMAHAMPATKLSCL